MRKPIKYVLLAVAGVILILAAGAIYLVATFDPNAYKPQIIKAVKDSKHRDLKLDGDIKLTLFPSIGASLSKVSLSEFQSKQEFASIDSAHVSLALLPLFAKQVVIDKVSINGMTLHLIKHADGKLNIDDLLSSTASSPAQSPASAKPAKPAPAGGMPVKLDVAAISISNANLSYRDEAGGARYEVKDLNLDTGRIASGVPTRVKLQTSIHSNKPRLDIALQMQAGLKFDLDKLSYQLDNLELQSKANGDLGNIDATLTVPDMKGDRHSFKISSLDLDAEMKQPEQSLKVKLASPISGNLETQQFNLPSITLAASATGDKLPNKSVSGELKGNAALNLQQQQANLKLAGDLLQSKIKLEAAVNDFARPAIRFNLDADQFDADAFLPKTAKAKASEEKSQQAAQPEQPFDLSALKTLNLDGSLRLGAIKAFNVKAQQLRIGIKAKNGLVSIAPINAKLYQGNIDGKASVNARTSTFTVDEKLAGVDIGPLVKDALNLDLVEGKGNAVVDVSTHGNTVSALKKGLNGNASVNLANGAIKGIDLAKLVQGVQSLNRESTVQTLGVDKSARTEFTKFHASFRIRNGVAHNDDLAVLSTVLRLGGNGDIDIGRSSLNYKAKAVFAKTEQGRTATLPVDVSGTFDNPKFKVDYGAMLADVAKQRLNERKEELKAKAREDARKKLEEQLKGGLKGLFQ
jgi:AsmA protein